jgi:hypothetical protein
MLQAFNVCMYATMYVYVCVCMHACRPVCKHAYCVCMLPYMHVCHGMHIIRLWPCMCVFRRAYMHVCRHECVHVRVSYACTWSWVILTFAENWKPSSCGYSQNLALCHPTYMHTEMHVSTSHSNTHRASPVHSPHAFPHEIEDQSLNSAAQTAKRKYRTVCGECAFSSEDGNSGSSLEQ